MRGTTIKQILATAALLALLAACASQPPYRVADENGYGYSERQLTADQFRIHFRGRGDDAGRAIDYAMMRASELTLEQGFDWFDVATRDTLVNSEQVPAQVVETSAAISYATVRDCGLLNCTTYYRPVSSYHTSANAGMGNPRNEVEVIMDIRMGKGIRPHDHTSYDARELYSRLIPET